VNSYTHDFHTPQDFVDGVEIPLLLDEDAELCPASEVFNLLSRHTEREPREKVAARNAVLFAYENGAIGATEALAYLEANELFGEPDFFLRAFAAGCRSLASREGRK
jgi:hypothetical protein